MHNQNKECIFALANNNKTYHTMTQTTYKQMSQTAEGRKELHTTMLADVKKRMSELVASLPEANRAKCQQLFDMAYAKIETMGNGDLFTFFADEQVSMQNFLRYCQDAIK